MMRRGATLISVLAAMAIIAICLTLVLQAYLHGGRFVELQQRRSQAAAACQAQIEQARARGYAALPEPGEHAFAAGEGLAGTLVIEVGPREDACTVTARVRWARDDAAPGGDVELVTIMTPRGIGG
ncbi:MAG: type II secretion system protein [Armatimonadota bacterium]|jgi:type II secretory pathway pseudopilin PulG